MSVCRVVWTTWLNSTLLVKIMINEMLITTNLILQVLHEKQRSKREVYLRMELLNHKLRNEVQLIGYLEDFYIIKFRMRRKKITCTLFPFFFFLEYFRILFLFLLIKVVFYNMVREMPENKTKGDKQDPPGSIPSVVSEQFFLIHYPP